METYRNKKRWCHKSGHGQNIKCLAAVKRKLLVPCPDPLPQALCCCECWLPVVPSCPFLWTVPPSCPADGSCLTKGLYPVLCWQMFNNLVWVSATFHTPTKADFKLPTWHHWMRSCKEMHSSSSSYGISTLKLWRTKNNHKNIDKRKL